MRIVVFSDSHKNTEPCIKTVENLIGVDMIRHAGDHASDAKEIERIFPDIPVKYVSGNCDFATCCREMIIEADGKKIFLTHGHNYNVKNDLNYDMLINAAKEKECDCVVFGHTHTPFCDASRGITVLNPGSVKYGRTYGVIEIEDGVLKAAVCNVPYMI